MAETETMAVPLQPIRAFGGNGNDWHNMLIFGDNLQALKTLHKLKEGGKLVNSDGSRGVKLVFIDPPFGTGDEYGPSDGEMAYSARVQGAKFVSFLRKRLLLIREVLAPTGVVFVRLDHHFGHYIKVIMDEVFGPQNFRNEIVINRVPKRLRNLKRFNVSTESLYFYSKGPDYFFKTPDASRFCHYCGKEKDPQWEDMTSPGLRNPPERVIFGKELLPRRSRHFMYTQDKVDELERAGRLRINPDVGYWDLAGNRVEGRPEYLQADEIVVDNNWTDIQGYAYLTGYPTENHEALLERVLLAGSVEGDIVLDAFAGSGTTLAVAEKLGRKWIGIDCGKLSIYTIQKRMLNLTSDIGKRSGKRLRPRPFTLYNAGLYDFSQLRELPWDGWRFFALNLFQCRNDPHRVGGILLDGYRENDDVLVFNHRQHGGVVLDYGFIDDLHARIGSRIGSRFFIIAPAASVMFIEDYVEQGDTRYYVLRIPYSIINELHVRDFEAITQPVEERNVNSTVEAVGFDFVQPPKVECEYFSRQRPGRMFMDAVVKIDTFISQATAKGASSKGNLETFSMILVDYNYPYDATREGKEAPPPFSLDNVLYANDIAAANWEVSLPLDSLGAHIMLIYIDIYGNEHVEIKAREEFTRDVREDVITSEQDLAVVVREEELVDAG